MCVLQDPDKPLIEVDCSTAAGQHLAERLLGSTAAALTGSSNGSGRDGTLLQQISAGTLVLNNMHKVSMRTRSNAITRDGL